MTFTKLSSISSFARVSRYSQIVLISNTWDRAVLICEISDFVLQTQLRIPQDDLKKVKEVQAEVSNTLTAEQHIPDRFLEAPFHILPGKTLAESVSLHRPKGFSWLEYICAGGEPTGAHLSETLSCVFKEQEHIDTLKRIGISIFSYQERCRASGHAFDPAVSVDQSYTKEFKVSRRTTGAGPRNRIKHLVSQEQPTCAPWRFVGILKQEAKFRVMAASIAKSWTSTRSAWNAYHEVMVNTSPMQPQFPVRVENISVFACVFDNPDSFDKYLQHVKKACILVGRPFLAKPEETAVKMGIRKGSISRTKSFICLEQTQQLVKKALSDKKHELARLCAVAYTYQLRVQSECFPLQTGKVSREQRDSATWHSCIEDKNGVVSIRLRIRKNKSYETLISRECTCNVTPLCCGPCALRYQMKLVSSTSSVVFPGTKYTDILTLKKYASELGYPPPSWHGFRRGRTTDLISGRLGIRNLSWEAIFESGGWSLGSRALLKYIQSKAVDPDRVAAILADGSDSD